MTDYDELTAYELQAAYEYHFKQRYPDESLLLRRVLKYHSALVALRAEREGRPAIDPPKKTGVYLIYDGLGFQICEYDTETDGDGTCVGWVGERDDEVSVIRWWHLPAVPQEPQP